jgi:transposase
MEVMLGVDPHKGSHTAVAVDVTEAALDEIRVRTGPAQLERLLEWASAFPERTWAIENATGLGHLLAQQLVAAGERVLDVQPKLAARVRLLDTESTNKNDPHDARSVAIAALRSTKPRQVVAEDHASVARLWAKREKELTSHRTRTVCRLHALLCDLIAGGVPDRLSATKAATLLASVEVTDGVTAARVELGREHLEDIYHLDEQIAANKARLKEVVKASGSSGTEIFGVGPVVAATVIGLTGDLTRFPTRAHFASFNGTAPIDVSSGDKKIHRLSMRGSRQMNSALHAAAITQMRFAHSPGRAYYDRKVAEGKTHKEALRCLKRRISNAVYDKLMADARRRGALKGPGGQAGNDSASSATGSHPATPALRTSHSRTRRHPTAARRTKRQVRRRTGSASRSTAAQARRTTPKKS